MGKLSFWLMTGVAAVIFIYVMKFVANQSGVQGFKDFAQAI